MSDNNKPTNIFGQRTSVEEVEEGNQLAPKFDEKGCIPCITTHAETKEVLMFAFMNSEALQLSISTKLAHYWSRSRQKLWKKGESSGMFQKIQRMLIDDDQDCLIIEVLLTAQPLAERKHPAMWGIAPAFIEKSPYPKILQVT